MAEREPDPKRLQKEQFEQALNGLGKDVRDFMMGNDLKAGALEKAMDVAVDLYAKSSVNVRRGLELVNEMAQQLTGVQSLKIIPKPPLSLEVDIRCAEENRIPLMIPVAPLISVDCIKFGKRIHFESLWDQTERGLRMSIMEGFSLEFAGIPFIGTTWVHVKGSALLKHDEHKRLVVVFDTVIPGVEQPVKITVPLTDILKHARTLKNL